MKDFLNRKMDILSSVEIYFDNMAENLNKKAKTAESYPTTENLPTYNYPTTLDGYKIGKTIGKGSFSIVFKAKVKSTNQKVALKVMKGDYKTVTESYKIELTAYAAVPAHPGILKLFTTYKTTFVFELANSSAQHLLFNSDEIQICADNIIASIKYIHSYGLVHLDVKPANILFIDEPSKPRRWVLADFGMACKPNLDRNDGRFGSPAYMSPETFKPDHVKTLEDYKKVDMWSFGVVLGMLISGQNIFLRVVAMKLWLIEKEITRLDQLLQYKNNSGTEEEIRDIVDDLDRTSIINSVSKLRQAHVKLQWNHVHTDSSVAALAKSLVRIDPQKRRWPL